MQSTRILLFALATLITASLVCHSQTITGFNPPAGPVGTQVLIDGTGFYPTKPIVRFNGVQVNPSLVYVNNTQGSRLTTYVPSGATTGRISVQTTGPQVFSTTDFFVGAGPYVTDFSPNTGGPTGGTTVSIQGVQFTGVTGVKFNGQNASSFIPNGSGNLIQATTPNGVTTGPITVTTPQGSYTTPELFYVPPTVSSFTPTNGPVGTTVVLSGGNFLGTMAVSFSGVSASFTVSNNTQIVVTVPVGSSSGKIIVDGVAGSYQTASQFLVSPVITGFAPHFGSPGTNVTIVGSNFLGNTSVRFNGTLASLGTVSSNQITTTVPNGATTGPISVTTTNGTAISTDIFYLPPVVTSFNPSNSPPGSTVTVTGMNFQGATAVKFNGQSALTFSVLASNLLTAVVPNGVMTGPISVTGPAGTGASERLFYALPIITGFIPDKGLPGTNVTVFGNNFQGTTMVKFNGTNAMFSNVTSNQLKAVVPAGAGTGPISLTAPAGTAVSEQNFVFDYMSDVQISSFTDSPDPITVTSNLTLTIRPATTGPSPATNAIVSVTLNPSVILKSASTTQGIVNTNSNPVVFNLGVLNSGSVPTLSLVVTPQLQGQVINTAMIESNLTDPDDGNNSLQTVTTVQPFPILNIRHLPPDKVRLSWSAALTNYVLQSNPKLEQPNDWSTVTDMPKVTGNERVVTNTITSSNRFFRLKK